VRGALNFLDDFGLRLVASERVLVSKRHGYAGSCDAIALRGDGSLVVLDWKTGRRPYLPESALQIGGYAIALKEMAGRPVAEGYVVALRQTGRYVVRQVNLPLAKEGFLAALALWKALRGELYGRG